MSVDTKLMPLATLADGRTLYTTPGQDQYFIVKTSGAKEKVGLQAACKWYLSATKVVWGKRKKGAQKRQVPAKSTRSTEKWNKKMREALGETDDPPKS